MLPVVVLSRTFPRRLFGIIGAAAAVAPTLRIEHFQLRIASAKRRKDANASKPNYSHNCNCSCVCITPDSGMGLFASRDITKNTEVNFENPVFTCTQRMIEQSFINVDTPTPFSTNSMTVLAMVDETLSSAQYPCKPSEYIPIRCLGSIPQKHQTVETAFQLIGDAYQLPSSVWTEEECLILHESLQTRSIQSYTSRAACSTIVVNIMLHGPLRRQFNNRLRQSQYEKERGF